MIDAMALQADIIQIAADGPCPCRSGKVTAECCMAADGTFRVRFPSPLPPGGITGFSHAQCTMRDTHNCSEDVSREHFMSKSVLDLFRAKTVDIHFPWNDVGGKTPVDIENLTSGILCARHNSALAPLDAVAVQAFGNLLDATVYVIKKSLATKRVFYAASGEGLELWALKLLFGAYHATMAAKDGEALKDAHPLDFSIFQRALENGALAPPCGLYVRRVEHMGGRVGWGPPATETGNRVTGLRFLVGPLECELIVDSAGLDLDAIRRQNYYRPSAVDLIGKRRDAKILLSGAAFARNESVRLELWEIATGAGPSDTTAFRSTEK